MNIKGSLFAAIFLLCVAAPAQAQTRFSYSADGSEVTDQSTRLTWRRCVEGMSWSGSGCTGTAGSFTHSQALVRAQAQTGWRLPNVKELASIVDDTRSNPAIDPNAFPDTPTENFWSTTPQVGFPQLAWLVRFYDGLVSDYILTLNRNFLTDEYGRTTVVRVRFVRSTP